MQINAQTGPTAEKINEAIGEEVLPHGVANVVDKTLRLITLAEVVIEEKQDEHPEVADEIDAAFPKLKPNDLLIRCPEKVYRAHVEEMLNRVASDTYTGSLDWPTDAEVLALLVQTMQEAPLSRTAQHAFVKLTKDVVDEDRGAELHEHLGAKHYQDDKEALDFIADMKRKLKGDEVPPRVDA